MSFGEIYDFKKAMLLSSIPPIKRARGFRLYDYRGNRYLDCYRDGGHSILGHREGELNKVLKNVISKGLVVELPSIYVNRCRNALRELFAGYHFLITGGLESAIRGISQLFRGSGTKRLVIFDPLLGRVLYKHSIEGLQEDLRLLLWRPFTDKTLYSNKDVLIPILPFSVSDSPFVVCFPFEVDLSLTVEDGIVSPMLLAGFARAIYDLIKTPYPGWVEDRFPLEFPLWKRSGPYMIYRGDGDSYESVFINALDNGIVLPPSIGEPAILPFEISDGEYKKLLRFFSSNIDGNIQNQGR